MNLPSDASSDQSNVPEGYYRRSNGMLHQRGEQPANASNSCPSCHANRLTSAEVLRLAGLGAEEREQALQRSYCAAGLIRLQLMSKEDRAQAMLDALAETALMPIVMGLNIRADIDNRMKAIDKWLDRERGKPSQAIMQTVNVNVKRQEAQEHLRQVDPARIKEALALLEMPVVENEE